MDGWAGLTKQYCGDRQNNVVPTVTILPSSEGGLGSPYSRPLVALLESQEGAEPAGAQGPAKTNNGSAVDPNNY